MDKVSDFIKIDIELVGWFVISGNVKIFVVVWVHSFEFHANGDNMGDLISLKEGKIASISIGTKEKVIVDFGHVMITVGLSGISARDFK